MTATTTLLATLHEAVHRVPGVPAHPARAVGHQGHPHHRRTPHASTAQRRTPGHRRNHSPDRPPRVLVAWQRRIATLFGLEL